MPQTAFVEKGLGEIKGLFRKSLRREIDWETARKKLAEHRDENPESTHYEAARKVFLSHVAPSLFFAGGERQKPTSEPGVQSAVTPEVREFALHATGHFGTEDFAKFLQHHRTMHDIQNIVRDVARIRCVQIRDDDLAQKLYASQTAKDIAVTRRIPTDKGRSFGCTHGATLLVSALRAVGVNARFVRTFQDYADVLRSPGGAKPVMSPHSVVIFEHEGKSYVADPWEGPDHPLLKLTRKMERRLEKMKRNKEWMEGEDQWGMGITSYRDFFEGLNKQDVGRFLDHASPKGKPEKTA